MSASQMMHALSYVGNGNMATGIIKMADSFAKEGYKIGIVKGAFGGVAVTSLLFGMENKKAVHPYTN